jgi:hypothetical protein
MVRQGLFKIWEGLTKQPEIMALFFEKFTPIRFDLDLHTGYYLMLCQSELFDIVKDGQPIPFYDAEFRREEKDVVFVSVTKLK